MVNKSNAKQEGWTSSPPHKASERANSIKELQRIYAEWAVQYEAEMFSNGLHSCKKIVEKLCEINHRNNPPGRPCQIASGQVRILDAGCGTGLIGAELESACLRTLLSFKPYLIGVDISLEMLEIAQLKRFYEGLFVASVSHHLPFQTGSFDFVVAAGLFMPGHCGPECVPALSKQLRAGGMLIFTVREADFRRSKGEYLQSIERSGSTMIDKSLEPYYGPMQAYVITVERR